MSLAWIGIGTNQGDRRRMVREALRLLCEVAGVEAVSRPRRTKPWGVTEQPDFINLVVRVKTALSAENLLDRLLSIEAALGRVRTERWAARTIDLDLLLYDRDIINSPRLTLPHPELQYRRFVLEPLCDLDPELSHPVIGKPMRELLEALREE